MAGGAPVAADAERGAALERGAAWLAATDHKKTAAKVGIASLFFFGLSGLLALTMRAELAQPGLQFVSDHTYDELFTMHGSGMIYLFLTPAALGLGLYLVPLQIGASEIAAPRLALFGFWIYLCGGLTMYSGFLTNNGAGDDSWTATIPLSGSTGTPGVGMDLWVIGVALAVLGSLFIGITILLTILRLRAPGMTMLRMPVFSWTMLVTVFMVVASFPVLVVAMALLLAERHIGGIFTGATGTIAYQHLFWFYGHPVVYVMFFPFVGAVGEAVSTFSRKRFFGYRALVVSLLFFTALSMAVWGHHMFVTGAVKNQYYSLTSQLLAVPAGIEYLDLIGTMIGGAIVFRAPMLFALGFITQFLIGGLTGIVLASPPLDYHVNGSYFVVAHFHYTLFAGSLFGLLAGVHFWFPKATGAMLRERLAKLSFWVLVVGANLTFFPMFFLGYDGMPRRVPDYEPRLGDLNLLSSIGAGVIAVGVLLVLANLFISLRRKEPAGNDPWGAQTLEWWTTSPPPRDNFTSLPEISSYAPLLDRREAEEEREGRGTEVPA
ncbi:MAG TPA: cbb3-type cytochrome c oxidase subunit I [Solirubrobacterales bacterium]|jgi:cytochrome c oxidase subunit 1|nr:cbb3-type cytochrome c oxidase subunit I [Solirubrobacterales bacterium]